MPQDKLSKQYEGFELHVGLYDPWDGLKVEVAGESAKAAPFIRALRNEISQMRHRDSELTYMPSSVREEARGYSFEIPPLEEPTVNSEPQKTSPAHITENIRHAIDAAEEKLELSDTKERAVEQEKPSGSMVTRRPKEEVHQYRIHASKGKAQEIAP